MEVRSLLGCFNDSVNTGKHVLLERGGCSGQSGEVWAQLRGDPHDLAKVGKGPVTVFTLKPMYLDGLSSCLVDVLVWVKCCLVSYLK